MKIKMLRNYGMTADFKIWLKAGDIVDLNDDDAASILNCRAGEPVAVKAADSRETRVAPKRQTRKSTATE